MKFIKAVRDTALSVAHGREFIVKKPERGYNKFRKQICSNHGIDIDEYTLKLQKYLG